MKDYKLVPLALPLVAFALAGCDVTQTEEGKLPDVDVSVEEGNLPKYDVDAGDIDVQEKDVTVTVPTLDYDTPAEDEAEERAGRDGAPEGNK